MQHSTYPQRLTWISCARPLATAVLVTGVLVAGCGGGSGKPAAPTAGAAVTQASSPARRNPAAASPSSTATAGAATSSQPVSPADMQEATLAFARCMRANGAPNFPDPSPNGGFVFSAAQVNLTAPAVEAAQAKCRKLLPDGGPPGPGTTTHPSARTLAKLLTVAQCMRQHGVPEFPDPRTFVPINPFGSGQGVITDYDGAILLFPSTLNMQSPAYTQAAATCGGLAQKLGRGPHG